MKPKTQPCRPPTALAGFALLASLLPFLVALLPAVPAGASDLAACRGMLWPERVPRLALDLVGVEPPPQVGPTWTVWISIEGGEPHKAEARFDEDRGLWVTEPARPTRIGEVDVRPEPKTSRVSGPSACGYQPIDGECAAWFRFDVEETRARFGVELDPRVGRVRFPAPVADGDVREPKDSCLPTLERYRRLVHDEQDRQQLRTLREAFRDDPDLAAFDVGLTARGDVLVLSGVVSPRARQKALILANRHAGDWNVKDELRETGFFLGSTVVQTNQFSVLVEWLGDASIPLRFELPLTQLAQDHGAAAWNAQELVETLREPPVPEVPELPKGQGRGRILGHVTEDTRERAQAIREDHEAAKSLFLKEVEQLTLRRLAW